MAQQFPTTTVLSKTTNFQITDAPNNSEPVKQLIGKTVLDVWLIGNDLIVRFEQDQIMQVHLLTPPELMRLPKPTQEEARGKHPFVVRIGSARTNADWSAMQEWEDDYTRSIRGRRFSGIEGSVVIFGAYGVLMLDPPQWVRKKMVQ